MAKLIVELPDDVHKELKKVVMLQDRTIKEVVTDLVDGYLLKAKEEKNLDETGLWGKWEDTRSADKIIADIKKHRSWRRKDPAKGA